MGTNKELVQKQKQKRLGEEKLNNQECLMKIIEYNKANDIIIEFQDEYKARVHTSYDAFLKGVVKNPYHSNIYNVGMIGNKCPVSINKKHTKEYLTWHSMLQRCYSEKFKEKHPTYQSAICCKEWLLYENFYKWLHNQENFNKWLNGKYWAVDKDILIKGNKIYSPETCCLVPININSLFTKSDSIRGKLPIGITKSGNSFRITSDRIKNKRFSNIKEAFCYYKKCKENIIKQMAQEEYDKGNITKKCYDAMMNYQVEITD